MAAHSLFSTCCCCCPWHLLTPTVCLCSPAYSNHEGHVLPWPLHGQGTAQLLCCRTLLASSEEVFVIVQARKERALDSLVESHTLNLSYCCLLQQLVHLGCKECVGPLPGWQGPYLSWNVEQPTWIYFLLPTCQCKIHLTGFLIIWKDKIIWLWQKNKSETFKVWLILSYLLLQYSWSSISGSSMLVSCANHILGDCESSAKSSSAYRAPLWNGAGAGLHWCLLGNPVCQLDSTDHHVMISVLFHRLLWCRDLSTIHCSMIIGCRSHLKDFAHMPPWQLFMIENHIHPGLGCLWWPWLWRRCQQLPLQVQAKACQCIKLYFALSAGN